jgi:hypothetical protein
MMSMPMVLRCKPRKVGIFWISNIDSLTSSGLFQKRSCAL